jgi:hypothetical protein
MVAVDSFFKVNGSKVFIAEDDIGDNPFNIPEEEEEEK